jgi:hypothetical protein
LLFFQFTAQPQAQQSALIQISPTTPTTNNSTVGNSNNGNPMAQLTSSFHHQPSAATIIGITGGGAKKDGGAIVELNGTTAAAGNEKSPAAGNGTSANELPAMNSATGGVGNVGGGIATGTDFVRYADGVIFFRGNSCRSMIQSENYC